MLVNRRTFLVKPGCMEKLASLLIGERTSESPPSRIYTPDIGPFDVLVFELEFESLGAYEKFWSDWAAKPETEAFMEKWYALIKPGGKNEIWTLVE